MENSYLSILSSKGCPLIFSLNYQMHLVYLSEFKMPYIPTPHVHSKISVNNHFLKYLAFLLFKSKLPCKLALQAGVVAIEYIGMREWRETISLSRTPMLSVLSKQNCSEPSLSAYCQQ